MLDLLRISMSKRAALESDLGTGLPNVRANSAHLRQIVLNLVTNASEAIGDCDGVVSVKTRCMTVGRDSAGVTWEHWATGHYLRLEVSDTGCGIPLETQARVFDPFFTTKSAGRGLGIRKRYQATPRWTESGRRLSGCCCEKGSGAARK
jgi:two-component system, cell cycle sensor histidine kinase and response regulator CckA